MALIRFVLKHPYSVASLLILICLLGAGAAWRMPIDIFPEINIPVVSVVWTYNMYQVPAASLTFTPRGPAVAVVNTDNQVRYHPVTIGRDDGDHVELSSGVSSGDRLVLNISNQIAEGQKVRVAGSPSSMPEGDGSSVAMTAH